MTDEPQPPRLPLTDFQATRIDYARRDLEYARSEDLDQLPPAGLVRLIEQLRMRLHDTIAVVDEISQPSPRIPNNADRHP